jgi:hypothetical protein
MEFESWVATPSLSGDEGSVSYIWNSFQVKKTPKGLGVFATVDMEAGWMLPYGGVELDEEKFKLLATEQSVMLSYVANGQTNESGEIISWLDANPMNYPSKAPKYAWIGSFVNEPSHNETINCILFWIPSSEDFEMPHYPLILRDPHCIVCVQIVKGLKAGEELLLNYGVDDEMRNSLGYQLYGKISCEKKGFAFALEKWTQNAGATNKKRKANKEKKASMIANMNEKKKLRIDAAYGLLRLKMT